MSKETFDFSEALRRMKEGKKVKRTIWEISSGIWIEQGKIFFENINSPFSSAVIQCVSEGDYPFFSLKDILATDWEEVEG